MVELLRSVLTVTAQALAAAGLSTLCYMMRAL